MNIEQEVQLIRERNRRVEADKAWEGSWTRILSIAAVIYIIAVAFLYLIEAPNFYIAALLPPTGFMLSTLSLPIVKTRWTARYENKKR